jgi:hypothetical protein
MYYNIRTVLDCVRMKRNTRCIQYIYIYKKYMNTYRVYVIITNHGETITFSSHNVTIVTNVVLLSEL